MNLHKFDKLYFQDNSNGDGWFDLFVLANNIQIETELKIAIL